MTMIALSIGDPCGIGPEIVLKALSDPQLSARAQVIGDEHTLAREATRLRLPMPKHLRPIGPDCSRLSPGELHAQAGRASFAYVEHAIGLALSEEVAAVVTAPISKEAWHLAGHRFPGHTELLADRCGGVPVRMMLANPQLRVVLVTIHLALRRAIEALTTESIAQTIRICDAGLRQLGIAQPRIAVAGLNPHAGEGGLFGDEELQIIAPAVEQCAAQGLSVSGPYAPDTIFMRARGLREFDAVIAMYHDQGLIPVKYLGVDDGVNVTLGLPFLRTSPDHGTAFDIAGRTDPQGDGLADARSLQAAIRSALQWIDRPSARPTSSDPSAGAPSNGSSRVPPPQH